MTLEEGADDYLNKPFDPFELVARIRAVLRRGHLQTQPLASARRLVSGDLSVDRAVDIRIAELRRALGDNLERPRYLETVIGEGYRFVGPVEGHS